MPVVRPGNSDSATFDNVLELLLLSGRSLPHALMMMIPEPDSGWDAMTPELRGFYQYHACLMEPWDGPAAVAFTDGRTVGATLDRNGLRPGRWAETRDGHVVLASEAGVLPVRPDQVIRKGRLEPGKLFVVDLERGRIVEDHEIKQEVARRKPYGRWYADRAVRIEDLPDRPRGCRASSRCARASSPSGGRRRTSACSSRRWPPPARSRRARWATTPRSRSSRITSRRCSPTSSSSSRRSRTRRSTRSARTSS
ncbi:MAG: hypothetical protein WKF31_07680 [Thermoleophilaceae bacterium]